MASPLLVPVITAAGNVAGGYFDSRNARAAARQGQAAHDAAAPGVAQATGEVMGVPEFKPAVDWASTPGFSAPRPGGFGSRTAGATPFDGSGFFKNVQPFDPRTELQRAGAPPDLTQMWKGVQPYNPAQDIAKIGPPPSLEQMLRMGTISASAFERIKMDPKLRSLQMRALSKLEEIANNNGMTIADRVRLREQMDTIARQERMARYAIQQDMEARGLSGSGVEIALSLAAHQGSIEGLSMAGAEAAARGEERALQATMAAGSLAGEIAAQDFEMEARKAAAYDAIATFNASQSMEALQANFQNRMQFGTAMADANQTAFANWMDVVKAKEGAAMRTYEMRFEQAEAYANAGQQWFSNFMEVRTRQYDAARNAAENYFQWAKAMDDYAVQEYDASFRAAQSEYDRYIERLKLADDQSRFAYGANIDRAKMRSDALMRQAEFDASRPGLPPKHPIDKLGDFTGVKGKDLLFPPYAITKGVIKGAKKLFKKIF